MISESEYAMLRESVISSLSQEEKDILTRLESGSFDDSDCEGESDLCSRKSKAVIVITRRGITRYESITEASRAISISKQRLLRALQSDDGVVKGIKPTICVDYALDDEK